MTTIRKIDRSKFDHSGMGIISWNSSLEKWLCAWWPEQTTDVDVSAAGHGDDPAEAFLSMVIDLGALEPGDTLQ